MSAVTLGLACWFALAVDRYLGEPALRWHPVVWMGKYLRWAGGRTVWIPAAAYGDYASAAAAWDLEHCDAPEAADLVWACEPSSPLEQSHGAWPHGLQQVPAASPPAAQQALQAGLIAWASQAAARRPLGAPSEVAQPNVPPRFYLERNP